MIELVDGFWVDPFSVTVVKELKDDRCAVFTTGQCPVDGFILPHSSKDVAEAITNACDGHDDDEDE